MPKRFWWMPAVLALLVFLAGAGWSALGGFNSLALQAPETMTDAALHQEASDIVAAERLHIPAYRQRHDALCEELLKRLKTRSKSRQAGEPRPPITAP